MKKGRIQGNLRTLQVWWRRNKTFLFGLVLALITAHVLFDAVLRERVVNLLWPKGYTWAMTILQFLFYFNIMFAYTVSVGPLFLFARVRKEVPHVNLADFKGHPRVLQRAKQWTDDAQNGIPRAVILAGRPGSGKHYLAECVAGELGVPLISLDLGEAGMLGSWGLIKMFWLFRVARRQALGPGCVIALEDITQTTAVGVWPGVRILYPIFKRLMREIEMLKEAKSTSDRLIDRFCALFGVKAAPACPRAPRLIFSRKVNALSFSSVRAKWAK